MKRNDSILVYAVTGLLLVILVVAVVFGESKPAIANADGGNRPRVATLPGVAPVNPEPEVDGEQTGIESAEGVETPKNGDTTEPGNGRPNSAEIEGSETQGDGKTGAGIGSEAPATASQGPVDLKATVVTSEMKLERALGMSSRNRDFRVVKSRRGDTLGAVVQRWCGDSRYLPDAEAVNEHLIEGTLTTGQDVVVPWVEAEIILAAETVRAAAAGKAAHATGQLYSLQKGDSLWKLAKTRVGENKLVPAWLERFKQLNPEITDLSVLVVGQEVRLPR